MAIRVGAARAGCLVLSAVSLVGALGGCGSSGAPSAAPRSASVAPTSPAAGTSVSFAAHPTKAVALRYARAVNLQPADLPGMRAVAPEHEAPPPTRTGLEEDRCSGEVGYKLHLAKVDSASFSSVSDGEHLEIHSNVEVFPTAAEAERNDAANSSQLALSCLERFLPRALARENGPRVHYGVPTYTRLDIAVTGGYGYSIGVPILGTDVESTHPHLYIDGLGFLSSEAEVAVLVSAFPRPPSAGLEVRIFELLHRRALSHRL